jgi:hypothetical protein
MRLGIVCAALAASLALTPSTTMAQGAGNADSHAGESVKMKGPPNANGASSGDKMKPDSSASGRSESSGGKMKGPPNADGAPGVHSPNDTK